MTQRKPLALLTGGSHGIGLELAKRFAADGYDLLLVALIPAELAEAEAWFGAYFPQTQTLTRVQDLSLPGAARTLHQWVKDQGLRVDVLVNSAGFGVYGHFMEQQPAREQAMIQLNAVTVYELTRLFAEEMVSRDSGGIINIASTSAYVVSPLLSAYSATKAFVYQFSRGFDYELRRRGSRVRILTACPPGTRTGFMQAAGMERSRIFQGFWSMDAPEVARDIYRAFQRGRSEVLPGGMNSLAFRLLQRVLPEGIKLYMVYDKLRPR